LPKHFTYLLLFIAVGTLNYCCGQQLQGRVTDGATQRPVSGALVSVATAKAFTNNLGEFTVNLTGTTDTLHVTHFGYKAFTVVLNKASRQLHIELEPATIALKQVNIHASRDSDFIKDSIANRREYAKQFNYTGPKVMDAFTGNANKQPGELISVNPFILVAALTKKSTPEYKFHQKLLQDEQAQYIDRKFNRGIVVKVTGLKGDTLSTFMVQYRPGYKFAKKATDYMMINYIKDSYARFAKDGFKMENPFR
jgi:hypothetical protein